MACRSTRLHCASIIYTRNYFWIFSFFNLFYDRRKEPRASSAESGWSLPNLKSWEWGLIFALESADFVCKTAESKREGLKKSACKSRGEKRTEPRPIEVLLYFFNKTKQKTKTKKSIDNELRSSSASGEWDTVSGWPYYQSSVGKLQVTVGWPPRV